MLIQQETSYEGNFRCGDDNNFCRDIFTELIEFDSLLYETELATDFELGVKESDLVGQKLNLLDFCQNFNISREDDSNDSENPLTKCFSTQRPLDFVYYKSSDSYELERFPTDNHLLFKVRSGKGDPSIYT